MKKYLLCILIIFSLLCFNGCSFFERYDPEEELSVHCGFDFTIYQYSGNVILHDTLGSSDSLELRNEDGEFKKELFKKSYTILDGHFQFFTWNDYKLFILKNNLYYVFDIKSYSYPPVDDDGNENFELLMYTEEEFRTAYPHYTSFNWIECSTPKENTEGISIKKKWIISKSMPFSIPENAKMREYTEHTTDDKSKNYIKGNVGICIDDKSQEFHERILNEWTKPIRDDKYFDKLNKYVFDKDFLVYNENYYYFYDNEKIGDKDTDTYYQDYLKIFAYDADMMMLYFYICY